MSKMKVAFVLACVVVAAGLAVADSDLTTIPVQPGAPAVPSVPQTLNPSEVETFYTDRITFQGANPGLALEDFETPLHPPGSGTILGCPEPADSNGSTGCFDPGDLLTGFAMTSPGAGTPGAELVIVEGNAGFGTPAGIVLGSNTFTAETRIDFNPPVTAVGFDVITLTSGNPVDITIFDAAGAPINGQTGVPGGAAGTFWGVDSDTPIAAVVITDPTGGDVELLDDMEFGDPIPVDLQSISVE